jgi:hypothetical protein
VAADRIIFRLERCGDKIAFQQAEFDVEVTGSEYQPGRSFIANGNSRDAHRAHLSCAGMVRGGPGRHYGCTRPRHAAGVLPICSAAPRFLKSKVKTAKKHFPFYVLEGTSRTHGSVFEVSGKYRVVKQSVWFSGTSEKISLGD